MPYLPAAVRSELNFTTNIAEGASGLRARRVQEWLTFAKIGTVIDGSFGPATKQGVKAFQQARGLTANGVVNRATWDALTAPLLEACSATVPASASVDDAILRIAKVHLAIHPIELGGDNRGPWVRAYCGADGVEYRWCAGFVTFVMKQACSLLDKPPPIAGSLSCDSLAAQAKERGRFIRGKDLQNGGTNWGELGRCQIFLVRRTSTDCTHTGFVFEGAGTTFATIEGNSNDGGSANGFEVCRRTRNIDSKDFIALP